MHYGQHSKGISGWQNVRAITSKLLANDTFKPTPGRGSGPTPKSPRREAIDLYDAGLTKLSTGTCIEKYKTKMRKRNWT
jgi:hypothetical protein